MLSRRTFDDIDEARARANRLADREGRAYCVVSGRIEGDPAYRIYPLIGFGLPAGGRLELVVEPEREREELEPPEKTSANGF